MTTSWGKMMAGRAALIAPGTAKALSMAVAMALLPAICMAQSSEDQVTRIDYYPNGLVSSTTLPDGSFTSYVYDAAQRLTDIVDAEGNSIHYTLDNAGNRLKEELKGEDGTLRRTLSRVYNQLGQLQTAKDADNHPTGFSYDANGNLDVITDALGRLSDNDYDPLNRLSKEIRDVGGIAASTQFRYDAQDNLIEIIDPNGLSTKYQYNAFGDLTRVESPDTGASVYGYDDGGNRISARDARGELSTYTYDALNRLTGISYSDTALNVTYSYDTVQPECDAVESFAVGRLVRMTDGSGETRYCHDRFGNLTRKVQITKGASFALQYAYTKVGELAAIVYPGGMRVDYVRDDLGRVTEVGLALDGAARTVLLAGVTYYPFGPVSGWTFGNGRSMSRAFDLNYQPRSILSAGVGSGGLDLGFGWDAVGNISSLHASDLGPARFAFTYDSLNRLTAFKDGPTGAFLEQYSYDATGNRTSFTNALSTKVYSYAVNSHRLSAIDGSMRGYDAAGNTTSIGGTSREFSYDAAGRMSAAERDNQIVMQYAYSGRGEQTCRYVGEERTYALYDELGHWMGDYGTSRDPIQQVIWLGDLPIGLVTEGELSYVEPDHIGTPRAVIDPSRDVGIWTWELSSEVFGNSPPNEDPDGDSISLEFSMRFPGQRFDSATGLNQNYFRDYEPDLGRFVQPDPLGLGAGSNAIYGYVDAAPLGYIDVAGLQRRIIGTRDIYPPPPGVLGDAPGTDPGQYSKPDPWDRSPAADGSTARDWGRPWGRAGRNGDWCVIKCKAEENGVSGRGRTQGGGCCPDFIYGLGLGSDAKTAWNNAWDAANRNTPPGCMKKHCNGLAGSCRAWKGGKRG